MGGRVSNFLTYLPGPGYNWGPRVIFALHEASIKHKPGIKIDI